MTKKSSAVFVIVFLLSLLMCIRFISVAKLDVFEVPPHRDPRPTLPLHERKRTPLLAPRHPSVSHSGCRQVFEIAEPNEKNKDDEFLAMLVDAIVKSKTFRARHMREEYYGILGQYVPSLIRNATLGGGFAGSNVTFHMESRLEQLKGEVPFLNCRLKLYKAEDFRQCVDRRLSKGRKTHLYYLGDSRTRQQMEVLLFLLKQYNFTLLTKKGLYISLDEFLGEGGDFHWKKFKSDITITTPDIPGLTLEFHWAPFWSRGDDFLQDFPEYKRNYLRMMWKRTEQWSLQKYKGLPSEKVDRLKEISINVETAGGGRDYLKRLLNSSGESMPSLVFLGACAWDLMGNLDEAFEYIDERANLGTRKLFPLLEKITRRTTVLVSLPEPFKEYVYFGKDKLLNDLSNQKNANAEWFLNAQAKLLPKEVIKWDTYLPFSHASYADCLTLLANDLDLLDLPAIHPFSSKKTWNCLERLHSGFETISVGVQILINHLCNDQFEEEGFCCQD